MKLFHRPHLLFIFLLAAACAGPPHPSPAAELSAAPVTPSTPVWLAATTETALPSPTPIQSPTPKPSPTLPAGSDFDCLPAGGQRVSAVVAGVIDGDTIRVQVGHQSFVVRYLGIDAPETSAQPPERMGPEATSRNRELVTGHRVTLVADPEAGDTDRYNRLLRFIIVDGLFVNVELVREGLARYYASENACGVLIFAAENEARSTNAGLWSADLDP